MQHSTPGARLMPVWRMQHAHENARCGSSHDPGSRRRKLLACETCYKKKIKCEFDASNDSTCIQCMRRNLNCKTVSRRGERDDLKRSRYVKALEERLRKTESLLKAAGILVEETATANDTSDYSETYFEDDSDSEEEGDAPMSPQGDSAGRSYGKSKPTLYTSAERDSRIFGVKSQPSVPNPSSSSSRRRRATTGRDTSPVSNLDNRNTSLYYGRASSFSILNREGIEWIKSKSGETESLIRLLSNPKSSNSWDHWRPDVFHDVFSSQVFKPLPPRADVFSLLRDYFRTVNLIFPLYHEETFMQLVEWQYTQQTCDDAARWASINIILALAYEYRFSNSQKSEKDTEKAWLYYKNALSVFPELVLRRTDLLSVQALLGMAIFLRGNSSTRSTVPIVTAAIRSCHRMGLHRNFARPNLPEVEQEQRKRVFWIAYILDQSTCIRLGSAPTQQFDDFDVDFPSDAPTDGLVMTGNKSFFSQFCRISAIRSRIYHCLYSTRALENKSTVDICEIVHKLHAELEEWKGDSRFEKLLKQRGTGEDFLNGFASAGLFLVYYNSLIMIHRLPLLINFIYQSRLEKVPEFDLRLILNQSSSSTAVCVQAARDTLRLVNNLPWGDIAWIWSLLYYVFLAVMTIFVNILRNSQEPSAKDDLQSLNLATTFFATLIPGSGPCNYAKFMSRMSTGFERIARHVLERDQKTPRVPGPDTKTRHSKSRAAPSTSRQGSNNNNTDASSSSSQSVCSPNNSTSTSTSTSIDIPNVDGLPPVSSCGYLVQSPSATSPECLLPSRPSNTTQTGPHHPLPLQTTTNINPNLSPFQEPTTQSQNPYAPASINTNTNPAPTIPLDEITMNFNFNLNFPQPDLWQVPLTADWEFGSPFLGGMGIFDHGNTNTNKPNNNAQNPFVFQGNSQPMGMGTGPGPAAVPASLTGGGAALGYGYDPNGSGNGNGNVVQGAGSASGQHSTATNPVWMHGCLRNPF